MNDQSFAARLQHAHQALVEGRIDDARASLEPLIADHPHELNVLRLAGMLRFAQGRADDAVDCLQAAGRQMPDDQWTWVTLLNGLEAAGQLRRGLDLCLEAVSAHPAMVELMRRMAALAVRGGEFDVVRRLAGLDGSDDPWLGFCLSSAVLRSGDWREGFALYEHRWAANDRARATPDWTGAPDPTGALVVYAEQGMGDVLQFLRFLPALRRRHGGTVALRVHAPLVPLLADGWADQVMDNDAPPSAIRLPPGCASVACTPLVSAPWLLNRLGEEVAISGAPYVTVPAGFMDEARACLGPPTGRLRIGLAWRGTSRAIPFESLASLLDEERAEWVSLQYGTHPGDFRLRDTMAGGDVVRAAGLIAQLDLVVTVDTFIAHLAAAQGIPTWILLDKVCCWRWTDHGERSAWYDSVLLFRQDTPGDWPGVVAKVRAVLAERF